MATNGNRTYLGSATKGPIIRSNGLVPSEVISHDASAHAHGDQTKIYEIKILKLPIDNSSLSLSSPFLPLCPFLINLLLNAIINLVIMTHVAANDAAHRFSPTPADIIVTTNCDSRQNRVGIFQCLRLRERRPLRLATSTSKQASPIPRSPQIAFPQTDSRVRNLPDTVEAREKSRTTFLTLLFLQSRSGPSH